MSEMKNLIINGETYEIVDETARGNSSVEIPKIYKWEKRKSGLDSYTTGSSTTMSSTLDCGVLSLPKTYALGYKTAEEAFAKQSGATVTDSYNYIGKTSLNSTYPYVYLVSIPSLYISSGTAWTAGVYKVTSISIKETYTAGTYLDNYKYTYSIKGQPLTNPVYVDEFLGYKYGLSEEDVNLFSTDNKVTYTLTNPD